jgi:hypothetical protein
VLYTQSVQLQSCDYYGSMIFTVLGILNAVMLATRALDRLEWEAGGEEMSIAQRS